MRVLIAFDKFKDALTAPAACEIAQAVVAESHPDWICDLTPLADGGEGFATILTAATGGSWHKVEVTGPRGRPVASGFGLVETTQLPTDAQKLLNLPGSRQLGVVEMATASGLESLRPEERDPWQASSIGTGQAVQSALEAGADAILLGVGGSATNDLGVGALHALGWTAVDIHGAPLRELHPGSWPNLAGFQRPILGLPPIRIGCDVSNPLLGERGATAVFGPQKGLKPGDFSQLESEIERVAKLLSAAAERPNLESTPGAGAAGGIAFGFLTAAQAELVPGFDLVEAWLGLEAKVAAADLIITGEGRFDESSLEGKGPGSLLRRATAAGKPSWVLAGALDCPQPVPSAKMHAITPAGMPLAEALRTAPENLARTLRKVLID